MSSSLYRPEESLDLPGFLRWKFGSDEPPEGQGNIWRLASTAHVHSSYHFFASNFAYVADKRGELTTLQPFVGQAIHRVTLDSQLRAGLPGRMAEVKARQLGWTVENIARALHFCLDENKRALILVDDEDVAAEQATRLGTMLNGLPGWLQPMRRIQNLKHLVFDNPNPKDRARNPGLNSASQITVPSSFRGVPPGFVCISEYAHMDAERQNNVQIGLISAMPLSPFSILIIDTTPAGIDDSYYPMVMEAVADNPKWSKRIENWPGELSAQDVLNGILGVPDCVAKGYPGVMVPAICPWRFHEEYTCRTKNNPRGELRPLTKEHRRETESTLGKLSKYGGEEEIDYRDRYGLSTERAFWRRRKIDGYKLPTEESKLLAFRQEFFSTIESAFQDTGAAPFDRACLDTLGRQERTPVAVGLFEEENKFAHWELNGSDITSVHRDRNPWHEIRIYAPPQPGEKYTMGIDTDIAYESPDSDATVAQIVRFRDRKVSATYEARVPSHLLMHQFYYLYKWYFNCYYAIETAGMGYDLVRRCIDRGMGNVHYYKRYDADYPEPTKFPGWETNRITRPQMDQCLTEMICHRNPDSGKAEPLINVPDAKTLKEIRGLSRTPSGAFKSARGKDDHVDALDIALLIAADPYSGLIRREQELEEQRKAEFEASFRWIIGGKSQRNRPDLARI